MSILAIDTCEGSCSAALVEERRVFASRSEYIGRGHAERLLPMLDALLVEGGVGYDSIRRIAVTTGPGTFTGLRIGLSVARGLGLALDVPVVGLSSLVALAASVREPDATVHAIVMGRGGQGFHQAFQTTEYAFMPRILSEARSMDGPDIAAEVQAVPGVVVGSGRSLATGGLDNSIQAVDPVVLGRLATPLDAICHPAEPTYLRAADAVKAKALLPTE
ncbi:tRNA (adenosine(37)-N6)-threonylcarbamoyltransferase complex dimerization subunit type 1 TsaB [Kordiimonas sp.]|uniref:tRNA (adenosine(37)-N6)-threonylcarbamoyltransferase complex dimerization subunit type 1 TsaB n=1 Tax=Kordiimonas sp. TaxID=1970157 RepID=UPI003A8F5684